MVMPLFCLDWLDLIIAILTLVQAIWNIWRSRC